LRCGGHRNLNRHITPFDLAIAFAVFAAKRLVPAEPLADTVFVGELALVTG
jgi:predicted ATPase with chaperone activity